MEGSLKFIHMLHGTPEEIVGKVNEYWNILPLFSAIRHNQHAKMFLERIPNPTAPKWMPFHDLLMDTEEIERTRQKYSRRDRQLLEEQWSFAGICTAFATSNDSTLQRFAGLAHGYSMSSHLLHKDADGVGMVWERYRRETKHQTAVNFGHAARVVSDICTFGKLRLLSLLRACSAPTNTLDEIDERYEALFNSLQLANENFNQTEYESTI